MHEYIPSTEIVARDDFPVVNVRRFLPYALPETTQLFLQDEGPYVLQPPEPTAGDLQKIAEAPAKATALRERFTGTDDLLGQVGNMVADEAETDLDLVHTLRSFYDSAQQDKLSDEAVHRYLEKHVYPNFDDRVYAGVLEQIIGWCDMSTFSWADSFAARLQSWRDRLGITETVASELALTPEEQMFYFDKLAPVFQPLIAEIEDGRLYTGQELAELGARGWERMRAHHGTDLLKPWAFTTWNKGTITNSTSDETLYFGQNLTRPSNRARGTLVHESMHILQTQWGAEQGRYGTFVSFGLPDSAGFREAVPALLGDAFGHDRGVTIDYHIAVGMALGKGGEPPATVRDIADTWLLASILEQEHAIAGTANMTPDLQRDLGAAAQARVAQIFGRVFALPERAGTKIPAVPVTMDLKYAQGTAPAVAQLRTLRPAIACGDWRDFARLFCGKWDPSIPLHQAVADDYPTDPVRYAGLFM